MWAIWLVFMHNNNRVLKNKELRFRDLHIFSDIWEVENTFGSEILWLWVTKKLTQKNRKANVKLKVKARGKLRLSAPLQNIFWEIYIRKKIWLHLNKIYFFLEGHYLVNNDNRA